jgi:hypothetical protein
MNPLSRISPMTDAHAVRLARPETIAQLAADITGSPSEATAGDRSRETAGRQRSGPRRWLIGVPVAAGLAAVALIASALGHPGQRVGPVSVGPPPAQAQALSFTSRDGHLTIIVRNPLADPSRYRAEFAAHHLNITLSLIPVSPSLVGTLTSFSESAGNDIVPITARGRCVTGDNSSACPVGVKIPDDFHGWAQLVFGRAAKPGEQYQSTASAFAPGEALHGLQIQGRTVAQVLTMLSQRHITVPVYNWAGGLRNHVPATWYVYDATPWASQQVMLFVGPATTAPANMPTQ